MDQARRDVRKIAPVIAQGVRYEQWLRAIDHGFTQHGGIIAAFDVSSGERLWAVQLYVTEYAPAEERDVQDVYVRELVLDACGHALLATDERRRTWRLDLATRAVTRLQPPARA